MPTAAKPTTALHPAVDAYIANAAPFAQPILLHLRKLIHEAAPEAVEEIKWSRPFFVYRGVILGNISAFQHHCSFGLWGKEIAAHLRAEGIGSSDGMGTFGKIGTLAGLPPRAKLLAYVREAARAIAEGERTVSFTRPRGAQIARVAKIETEPPPALSAALAGNQAASKAFEAMSPSCRREYCMWITEAKRDETRDRRLANAIEWIAQGKARNWKHEPARKPQSEVSA